MNPTFTPRTSAPRTSAPPPYALVTAGGTVVHLDRMRVLGNLAEGDFGVAIANALVERGIAVRLLMSRLGTYKHRGATAAGVTVVPYFSYADYVAAIAATVAAHGPPDWAFATAAVSDFGPAETVAGKIPSEDEVVIRLRRLPKVLDGWRADFGPGTTIVGFKLLSRADVDEAGLFAAAERQNTRAGLDATVGNFAEDLGGATHPIWWIPRGGEPVRVEGSRAEVAAGIVARACA